MLVTFTRQIDLHLKSDVLQNLPRSYTTSFKDGRRPKCPCAKHDLLPCLQYLQFNNSILGSITQLDPNSSIIVQEDPTDSLARHDPEL